MATSEEVLKSGLNATIVSMFPMEISEAKPGLYPGYFVIPAAPIGEMSTLIIWRLRLLPGNEERADDSGSRSIYDCCRIHCE